MQNGTSMDESGPWSDPHRPHFSATLLPYRSLSRKGFVSLMAVVCAVSFFGGLIFVLMGAWPVTGFFGIDVLLVYLAFRLNYRAARLTETIEISERDLCLTRKHPSGKIERFNFNPYWVRLGHLRRDNGPSELSLTSHGRKLVFASFLSDGEKENLAEALSAALARQRG